MAQPRHSQSLCPTCLQQTWQTTTFTGFPFTSSAALAAFTTPSLPRLRPLRERAGNALKSNVLHFFLIVNRLFRFIRKSLGHNEEEKGRTKTLEKIHETKNGSNGDSENTLPPSQRFFSLLKRKEVEGLIQIYQITPLISDHLLPTLTPYFGR